MFSSYSIKVTGLSNNKRFVDCFCLKNKILHTPSDRENLEGILVKGADTRAEIFLEMSLISTTNL
jgi:hypothetical protein